MKQLIPAIYEDGVFKPLKESKIKIKEHSKLNLLIVQAPRKKSSRLTAAKKLCSLNTPVSNWAKMEKEIEKGFLG